MIRVTGLALIFLSLAACGRDDEAVSSVARPRLHFCTLRMTVFFGIGGDSERIRRAGWSFTEPTYTWTDGPSAWLGIHLLHTNRDVQLQFRMAGMNLPPRVPFQPVDVLVNGEKLASWQVSDERLFVLIIPARMLAGPPRLPDGSLPFILEPGVRLNVEFRLPNAISPKQLGDGEDARRLGLRMRDLHIADASAITQPSGR